MSTCRFGWLTFKMRSSRWLSVSASQAVLVAGSTAIPFARKSMLPPPRSGSGLAISKAGAAVDTNPFWVFQTMMKVLLIA